MLCHQWVVQEALMIQVTVYRGQGSPIYNKLATMVPMKAEAGDLPLVKPLTRTCYLA